VAGIGNTKEFTATDGSGPTGDILNCNTVAGQTEVPNGKAIQGYSDAYITPTWKIANGTICLAQSATAPDPGAGGTITTAGVGVARVNPAAARTGVILQAGTIPGQLVVVENLAASANSITFAASGTSNVADGTGDSIAGGTSGLFNWDSIANLWYRVKAS
jgi:hypothetical protein